MGLKQIDEANRIIFLKRFTAEIIATLLKEHFAKHRIEAEKIKMKFFEPSMMDETGERKPIFHRAEVPRPPQQMQQRPTAPTQPITAPAQPQSIHSQPAPTQPLSPQPPIINPATQSKQKPRDLSLGKLESLLKDPAIQLIECPGPGKNLLIKRYNKVNVTKMALNQQDIVNIINSFSKQARIPIVGGILKVAVGNLVMSAVISEFVGSRFIINRATPYSLIG